MENMNENMVMNAEADGAVDTAPTKSTAKVFGTVVLGLLAVKGAIDLAIAGGKWLASKFGKKAKEDTVEVTYEDITDK